MVFMPNKSTPDYLFEKANQCFRRARTGSNARVELEALGNEFMVASEPCQRQLHRLFPLTGVTTMDKLRFDRTDYSVVVKNRAPPPGSWKWEIYRAGRSSPIKQSSVYFHTMVTANRAGKEALKQLLDKLPVSQAD